MHLKRLTKRERDTFRTRGWGCGGCDEPVDYVSGYAYASHAGHAARAIRPLCTEHARQLARRAALAATRH